VNEKKEVYVQPVLVTHELLRDITAKASGRGPNGNAFGHLFGRRFHRHR
jgi:hypothetical protein